MNAVKFIQNTMKIAITWMLTVVISTVVIIQLIQMTNNSCSILLELQNNGWKIGVQFKHKTCKFKHDEYSGKG